MSALPHRGQESAGDFQGYASLAEVQEIFHHVGAGEALCFLLQKHKPVNYHCFFKAGPSLLLKTLSRPILGPVAALPGERSEQPLPGAQALQCSPPDAPPAHPLGLLTTPSGTHPGIPSKAAPSPRHSQNTIIFHYELADQ